MGQEVLIASAFFTTIVVSLVALVLAARYWLEPSGTVTVTINGQPQPAERGRNLLTFLTDAGIYLPSPCGGRAMCGQCKVVFVTGASRPKPTELSQLTERETLAGVRLACVTKLYDDVSLQIPDELLAIQQRTCTVVSAQNVSTYLREIELQLAEDESLDFVAGQYVSVYAPAYDARFDEFEIEEPYRTTWKANGLLNLESHTDQPVSRAYSLANDPSHSSRATLLVRIALPPASSEPGTPPGKVSSYLFSVKAGDQVQIAGPFGNFHVASSDSEIVLIAGGAGIAPMRSILLDQLVGKHTQRKISLWYGVRSEQDLCYVDEFDQLAATHDNFRWYAALSESTPNDSWSGNKGLVHTVIHDEYLAAHPAPEAAEYYLCGPPVMSAAVIHMLEQLGVDPSAIYYDDFGRRHDAIR